MLCFRKFPVAKKFVDKGGGEHDFPSKTFCLTVPTSLGHRKYLCFRRLCHDFLSKIFCLTVPKIFVGESFGVSLLRVSKNFMLQRVMSQFFVEFFCLTVPTKFVVEPSSMSLVWGIEKIYASEGYVTIFCQNCFVSQYRKIP